MEYYIQGSRNKWEVVLGLEVHAQISSRSKLFSEASTDWGAEPNSQVELVDCGMPGALPVINEYYNSLQKLLMGYIQIFPQVNHLPRFGATQARIQKYDTDGHFNSWHYERGAGYTMKRCLVYMTYLNTVEDGGETEFLYQNKKIKPEVGKTIIWPSEWTHTHRGLKPNSGVKYISTGWYVHD